MSVSAIQSALNGHLALFATAQSLRVAYENSAFTPDDGETYLQPRLMPALPVAAALGEAAQNKQPGVFQVTIVAPSGQGWGDLSALADGLRAHFKRGTKLMTDALTVTSSSVGPMLTDDGRGVTLPVSVAFLAYVDN